MLCAVLLCTRDLRTNTQTLTNTDTLYSICTFVFNGNISLCPCLIVSQIGAEKLGFLFVILEFDNNLRVSLMIRVSVRIRVWLGLVCKVV